MGFAPKTPMAPVLLELSWMALAAQVAANTACSVLHKAPANGAPKGSRFSPSICRDLFCPVVFQSAGMDSELTLKHATTATATEETGVTPGA